MTAAILTAWFHYIGFTLMAGGALAQLYLLKLLPSFETVKMIARVDRVYGLGAVIILVSGIARMPIGHGGKGMAYYMHTGAFHGAFTLFVLAALLSIVPTIRFIKWNKLAATGVLPNPADWGGVRKLVHVQLTAIVLIAPLMAMMARGTGVIA